MFIQYRQDQIHANYKRPNPCIKVLQILQLQCAHFVVLRCFNANRYEYLSLSPEIILTTILVFIFIYVLIFYVDDHSRVRLMSMDGVPASNYINANFIDVIHTSYR